MVAEKPQAFCRKDNDLWQLASQTYYYRLVSNAPDTKNIEQISRSEIHDEMCLCCVSINAFDSKLVKKLSMMVSTHQPLSVKRKLIRMAKIKSKDI